MKKLLVFLTVFAVIMGLGISNTFAQTSGSSNGLLKQIEKLMDMVKDLQSKKDNITKLENKLDKKIDVLGNQFGTNLPQLLASSTAPMPKPGKMHLSIQELGNGRNEVNIKNAIVTEISTSTIVCITTPCNQPINLKVKILGLTFDVHTDTGKAILDEGRGSIKIDSILVGDYINVYGTQDPATPSVINAQIIRDVSLTKRISQQRLDALKEKIKARICIQVVTRAKNPQTGEIKDFPTPCDVPQGWVKIDPATTTGNTGSTNNSTTTTSTSTNATSTTQ